uniref:CCHC-type domain-containing protein n=1 Tax=Nicotiana tabacum TaxID=4097 RepID=A0A1S3ZZZ7_TOBAC|nr:PREDICTED: uncharacterized protein LOC107792247 [Nicotiana tabacum]
MSTNKGTIDIASTSGSKSNDQAVLTHFQRPPEIQDFKFKSLEDLTELLDKKLSSLNIRPIDLSKKFADKIETVSDYKNETWSEFNKLKGFIKSNSRYADKPRMQTYYYSRPTPQDVLIEERDWNQTNTPYSGFTGQLRGWWDNYLSVEEKVVVINVIATDEGVDNLGMALVKNREDVVYTLVLTILEHFNGRFTSQHETVRTLLNGFRCKTLSEFRWYKDTFMSRVMELPKNKYEHWEAKFIDGLPSLFAKRVRKVLRGSYEEISYKNYTLSRQLKIDKVKEKSKLGDFCAQFDLPGTSTHSKKKKNRYHRHPNPDSPYKKKRSRHRSKEECDARKAYRKSTRFAKNRSKRDLADIKCYKCGKFGHIGPNCKLQKLKTLELDDELRDKVYSLLYTSGSESDYSSKTYSEAEVDLLDLSDSDKDIDNTCTACKNHLKEVTDEKLREKIINLDASSSSSSKPFEKQKNEFEYSTAYSLSKINKRLHKTSTPSRDASFDDLKQKIKLIAEQMAVDICVDHPSAFWNRKRHIVTLPYEENFSEDDIPTKSRPCQMNVELVEFCKKEIDSLLQKEWTLRRPEAEEKEEHHPPPQKVHTRKD